MRMCVPHILASYSTFRRVLVNTTGVHCKTFWRVDRNETIFDIFLSRIERSSNKNNDGDGLLNFFRLSILQKCTNTFQKLKKIFWFLLVRAYLFVRYTCVGEVFFEWTSFVFASRPVSFAILCDEPPSSLSSPPRAVSVRCSVAPSIRVIDLLLAPRETTPSHRHSVWLRPTPTGRFPKIVRSKREGEGCSLKKKKGSSTEESNRS